MGAAALGASAMLGCAGQGNADAASASNVSWDYETDVLVVGYGFAGACAALGAQEGGSNVMLIEKAPEGGGSSAMAVGMIHTAIKVEDPQEWKEGRIRKLLGTVPDEDIKTFIDGELEIPEWLEDDLGADLMWMPAGTPAMEGSESAVILVDGKQGSGKDLWEFFAGEVASHEEIEVKLDTPLVSLIQAPDGNEVIGAVISENGAEKKVKTNRGVVLALGGYENNQSMQAEYHYPGIPFYPWGTPYNTGDGVAIAAKAGAKLWHFSCFEYAGFVPKKAYEELEDHPVLTMNYKSKNFYSTNKSCSFIFSNKAGSRFMNENSAIGHQKTTLPFNFYDEATESYVNYPFFFICDDATVKEGPLAPGPRYTVTGAPCTYATHHSKYEWSQDNSAEVEKGWIVKADTIEELATAMGIDPEGLAATVAAYNDAAASGEDPAFDRLAENMAPLATPPFYAVECMLSIINTMGGAARNGYCQVVDPDHEPIPRLYGAGEFGSFNGGLEYCVGNIAEAISSGRIAGRHAAGLDSLNEEKSNAK